MGMESDAREMFAAHYNCAQAVLSTFAEHFGLDRAIALRIATPFGGGIGHTGLLCGAVSGALMAIGLAKGVTIYDKPKKDACYALARTFQERFVAQHGTLTCPGLLGFNIGNPNELDQARALDLFNTRCPNFVGDAVTITAELLGMEP
jgi:C_GCAxxG_C_C family probable redox protein